MPSPEECTVMPQRFGVAVSRPRTMQYLVLLLALWLALPVAAHAQRVMNQPEQVVTVSKGASALLVTPNAVQRFSIGDPTVAEAVAVSPTEILLNGKALGTTTLLIWDGGGVRLYSIEVTADAAGLQRYLQSVLGNEEIEVSASGNLVTLSGEVRDASVATRAVEIAQGSGATVIDNITTAAPTQVLLHVRFAEVSRSALKNWQTAYAAENLHKLDDNGDWVGALESSSGLLELGLFTADASFEAFLTASISRGDFRSLAEPTLVTLPGREATFLAGGEFPYPTVQPGQQAGVVTIVWKEFGVRLRFTPHITRNGSIRLHLAPEVSSLDFGTALVIGGFSIPSLLSRKAETEVELREGQYLAIAGLVDNSMIENVSKIPILGDIPLLGEFFRSRDARERRTELLVLVTPRLVQPSTTAQPVPTGEPATWDWSGWLKQPAVRQSRPQTPAQTQNQP
jgi:pilus assembly protein CpaC